MNITDGKRIQTAVTSGMTILVVSVAPATVTTNVNGNTMNIAAIGVSRLVSKVGTR